MRKGRKLIQENPGYMMIEKKLLHHFIVIICIVEKSELPQDLQHLFLHPEYCCRVFIYVWDIICAAPSAKKRCRKQFLYYEYSCIGIVCMYNCKPYFKALKICNLVSRPCTCSMKFVQNFILQAMNVYGNEVTK